MAGWTTITYNDFTFDMNRMAVSVSPNLSETENHIVSYIWKFDIVGIISAATPSAFSAALVSAHTKLKEPAKTLLVRFLDNTKMYEFGPNGSNFLGGLSVAGAGDAINGGPYPAIVNIPESMMIGERTCQINFTCEITVNNLDYIISAFQTIDKNFVDFTFDIGFDIGPLGYTSRSIDGNLIVASPHCADQYRSNVVSLFPALNDFKRSYNFKLNKEKTVLTFSIKDEEAEVKMPTDIELTGTYRVSSTGLKPEVKRSLTGSVRGKPGTKKSLINYVISLFFWKFKGVQNKKNSHMLENVELSENLSANEIQFSFNSKEINQTSGGGKAPGLVAFQEEIDTGMGTELPEASNIPNTASIRGNANLTGCEVGGAGSSSKQVSNKRTSSTKTTTTATTTTVTGFGSLQGDSTYEQSILSAKEIYRTELSYSNVVLPPKSGDITDADVKQTRAPVKIFIQSGTVVSIDQKSPIEPRINAGIQIKDITETQTVDSNLFAHSWFYASIVTSDTSPDLPAVDTYPFTKF